MSTINNSRVVRVQVDPARPTAPLRLTVAISRRAMLRALELNTSRARFVTAPQLAPTGADVLLAFEVQRPEAMTPGHVFVSLIDPENHNRVALQTGRAVSVIEDGEFLHVDAPGVLTASVRVADASARPAYLRTTLLADIGLSGGRYEVL
jgi:hypothetical protein